MAFAAVAAMLPMQTALEHRSPPRGFITATAGSVAAREPRPPISNEPALTAGPILGSKTAAAVPNGKAWAGKLNPASLSSAGRTHASRPTTPSVDSDFLNPGRNGVAVAYSSSISHETAGELRMKDDFAVPAPMLLACNSAASAEDMNVEREKLIAQQEKIVDPRLFQNISLSMKHASFDEVCQELSRQTHVDLSAGRNTSDDNATIFVTSRPAREVMREVSRVFGFVWERSGSDGHYSYRLTQQTNSQVAEEKMRNDDVSKSIEAISRAMSSQNPSLAGSGTRTPSGEVVRSRAIAIGEQAFRNLSLQEMDLLRSGQQVGLGSPGLAAKTGVHVDGVLEPQLAAELLHSNGVREIQGLYMSAGNPNADGFIYLDQLKEACAGVSFLLRVTEFGGAKLTGEATVSAKAPDGSNVGFAEPVNYGSAPGPAETRPENEMENAKSKTEPGFEVSVDLDPKPTTRREDQGEDPMQPDSGSVTDFQGSYRTMPELMPPRPYMTSDDFWQAVHEQTKKDIVADCFSRLFKLKRYRGTLYYQLSQACDDMHYRWKLDEGFLTGRSTAYHWQRLNEVPKRLLLEWQAARKQNRFLPLRGVLAMSEMSDRQLDSTEVGKTIVNQWKLPEWGVPSRPHMSGPRDYVRQICRFLAGLPEDLLTKAENGTLKASEVAQSALNTLQYAAMLKPDTRLRVDYIPPEMYYWSPYFDPDGAIHDDLIFAPTKAAVMDEVNRRYPKAPEEVSYSDGLMGLLMRGLGKEAVSPSYDMGDQRFTVGVRQGGG